MAKKDKCFRTRFEITSDADCDTYKKEKLKVRFIRSSKNVAWTANISIGDEDTKSVIINNDDFYVIGNAWLDIEDDLKKGNKNFYKTYYYKQKYKKRMSVFANETGEMIKIRLMDENKMKQYVEWVHCQGTNNKIAKRKKPEPTQIFHMTKSEYDTLVIIALTFFREKMMAFKDPLMPFC